MLYVVAKSPYNTLFTATLHEWVSGRITGKLLLHLANVVENLNKKFSVSFISLNIYYASVHPGMGPEALCFSDVRLSVRSCVHAGS